MAAENRDNEQFQYRMPEDISIALRDEVIASLMKSQKIHKSDVLSGWIRLGRRFEKVLAQLGEERFREVMVSLGVKIDPA